MIRYRLTSEPDDNGTILVTSPDLPIVTYGDTMAEALKNAREAADVVVQSMIDAREVVPAPEVKDRDAPFVELGLQAEFKVRLHNALRTAGLTRADLQRALGWQRESVDRLFRLDHGSRLEQIEQAFRALGKQVAVSVTDVRVAA